MTRFWRDGHYRSGPYGDSHWVEGHWVERTDWDRYSSSQPSSQGPTRRYSYTLSYDRFTVPTACPECRAPVFFVICPNGGRVFFDRLGPPWPKHPCTDSKHNVTISTTRFQVENVVESRSSRPTLSAHSEMLSDLEWMSEGWRPVWITTIKPEDQWFVLKCRYVENDEYFRVLASDHILDVINAPAMISPMSDHGFARISFLTLLDEPGEIPVYRYADFFDEDPRRAADRRNILKGH